MVSKKRLCERERVIDDAQHRRSKEQIIKLSIHEICALRESCANGRRGEHFAEIQPPACQSEQLVVRRSVRSFGSIPVPTFPPMSFYRQLK